MHGHKAVIAAVGIVCWWSVAFVFAQTAEIRQISVQESDVTVRWNSPFDLHIVQRADTLNDAYTFASPVISTSYWQGISTSNCIFYRLAKVQVLFSLDPALKSAVQAQLIADSNKLSPSSDVYDIEMPFLLTLSAEFTTVSNLSGLEYAGSITNLFLANNQVSDVSPLAGLERLITLDLGYNDISDLSPLAGLTNLQNLYVDNNLLTNLNGLANLRQLRWLYAQNNQLVGLEPLADLDALMIVNLADNAGITNIQPLLDNAAGGGLGTNDIVDITNNTNIPTSQLSALTNCGVTVYGP